MKYGVLYDKVYGSLIGGAIGDALGAPVEMMSSQNIRDHHGYVDDFLPLRENQIGPHSTFSTARGSYTDDSRMMKLLCKGIIRRQKHLSRDDLRHCMIEEYHNAQTSLEREFLEEYYYKAVYDGGKTIFGGQPGNGAVMCAAPLAVICLCDPVRAFYETFDTLFFTEGYARYSAPIAAAVIAGAFCEDTSVEVCIRDALRIAGLHKRDREGCEWQKWTCYKQVGRECEALIERSLRAICGKTKDSLYEALYQASSKPFFADGAETAAVGLALANYAEDYVQAVTLCVNYGRDCDSTACVAGAVMGALGGASKIPPEWIDTVEGHNPGPTFAELAEDLCKLIKKENTYAGKRDEAVKKLIGGKEDVL